MPVRLAQRFRSITSLRIRGEACPLRRQTAMLPQKAAAVYLDGPGYARFGTEQNGLGDRGHGPSRIHRRLLQTPVSLGFREPESLDQEQPSPDRRGARDSSFFLSSSFSRRVASRSRNRETARSSVGTELLRARGGLARNPSTPASTARAATSCIGPAGQAGPEGTGQLGHHPARRLHAVAVAEPDGHDRRRPAGSARREEPRPRTRLPLPTTWPPWLTIA